MCRTYNGYDINWKDSWKEALDEVAKTGKLSHTVLSSPRQKDGRGNISPNTIIMPTLAEEVKLDQGKTLKFDEVVNEMVAQFKYEEQREPSESEVNEIKEYVKKMME